MRWCVEKTWRKRERERENQESEFLKELPSDRLSMSPAQLHTSFDPDYASYNRSQVIIIICSNSLELFTHDVWFVDHTYPHDVSWPEKRIEVMVMKVVMTHLFFEIFRTRDDRGRCNELSEWIQVKKNVQELLSWHSIRSVRGAWWIIFPFILNESSPLKVQ